jgi:hypothetical protein
MLFLMIAAAPLLGAQPRSLADIRQLTRGGQNAEAYWSPDGKRLVFQTTRPPYDCDQISAPGFNRQRPDHVRLLPAGQPAHRVRVEPPRG